MSELGAGRLLAMFRISMSVANKIAHGIVQSGRCWLMAAALIIGTSPVDADANYSKSFELSPLRISFADLQAVIDKTTTLIAAANPTIADARETLELGKGELKVKVTGHQLIPKGAKIPPSIDSFEYSYYVSTSAPIIDVKLRFDDNQRLVSVEGQSPEQVDALVSTLRDDLSKLTSSVGGKTLRAEFGFVVVPMLAFFMAWLAVDWWQTRNPKLPAPMIFGVIFILLAIFLPTDELFAGFSAIQGDAAFDVRYGPQISLWGLILTALAIPLSFLYAQVRERGQKY